MSAIAAFCSYGYNRLQCIPQSGSQYFFLPQSPFVLRSCITRCTLPKPLHEPKIHNFISPPPIGVKEPDTGDSAHLKSCCPRQCCSSRLRNHRCRASIIFTSQLERRPIGAEWAELQAWAHLVKIRLKKEQSRSDGAFHCTEWNLTRCPAASYILHR